jgi:hypothetical protein
MTDYQTIPGVELVSVGMEWPGSGGNNPDGSIALTLEHLVDMMVAANQDPLVRRPRVKFGHTRLQPAEDGLRELGDHDPFWNGTPAFGTVSNLRLTNDGGKLVGDLIEVPAWLAEALPSAWPNRSCEWTWDVETEGGKRYTAVLTAVGLLGEQQHAVKDLADLRRLVETGSTD